MTPEKKRKKGRKKSKKSHLEDRFKELWNGEGFVEEHLFALEELGRRWRFDFAWPAKKVAVEIEGGVFSGGRHTRGYGYQSDCEKYNAATMLGWKLIRLTSKMIDEKSVENVKKLLNED